MTSRNWKDDPHAEHKKLTSRCCCFEQQEQQNHNLICDNDNSNNEPACPRTQVLFVDLNEIVMHPETVLVGLRASCSDEAKKAGLVARQSIQVTAHDP